ncbi:MAG TPA: hypothetical protein VGK74_08655 [Symbiobacteriaceae bacterium]
MTNGMEMVCSIGTVVTADVTGQLTTFVTWPPVLNVTGLQSTITSPMRTGQRRRR